MVLTPSLKSFLKSSFIFTASGVIVNVLGYLFHLLVGRFLGPGSYSEITTVFAYGTLLSAPVMVLSVIVVGQSGLYLDSATKSAYLSSLRAYFDSLARSVPFLLSSYLILAILGYLNHLSLLSAFIMPAFVLTFLFAQLYPILLQSAHLFTPLSLILLMTGTLKLTAALIAPYYSSAPAVLLLLVFVNLAQIAFSRRYLSRAKSSLSSFTISQIWQDPRFKLTLLSLLGLIAFNNLDLVLAKQLLPADSAGIYGVWSLFAKAIVYSFLPLSSVALVFFTDRQHHSHSRQLLFLSVVFLGLVGIIAYYTFQALSDLLVTRLMGIAYAPLIPLLSYAALFGTGYSLIYLLNNYLLARSSRLAILPLPLTVIAVICLVIWGRADLSRFITTNTWIILGILSLYFVILSSVKFARTKHISAER